MNKREYLSYTEELKKHGYEYRENCPYEGRNRWIKFPNGDQSEQIRMDVYSGTDIYCEEYFNVKPIIVIKGKDCECEIRLDIHFSTLNIVDIEGMFEKYSSKFK